MKIDLSKTIGLQPLHCLLLTLFLGLTTLGPSFILGSAGAAEGPLKLVSRIHPAVSSSDSAMGSSFLITVSPDARYVLFDSSASNLATNTPLGRPGFPSPYDVFLRDRLNGTTRCVGLVDALNESAYGLALSSNGNSVLYYVTRSDQSTPDTILLRNLSTGVAVPISAPAAGLEANGPALDAVMTSDARFVAFVSSASNLVAGDSNRVDDVFLRDVSKGETTLVSVGAMSTGTAQVASGASYDPLISSDGSKVVFASTATNLYPGVPAATGFFQYSDIYLRDIVAGTTTWVSKDARGFLLSELGLPDGFSYGQVMSADGRYVSYMASSGIGQVALVLRFDTWSGTTRLVHTNAVAGVAPVFGGNSLAMTPDGRYLAFPANAGTPGYASSILIWDADQNSTTVASADLAGEVSTNSLSISPVLSDDGLQVAFLSDSSGLVTNSTSEDFHLYVRDLKAARTVLVDVDSNGTATDGLLADPPVIAGTSVFFTTLQKFSAGDRNEAYDVMARHLDVNSTELISVRAPELPNETPNGRSEFGPSPMNFDGSIVAFQSLASDLLPSATATDGDVFVQNTLTGSIQAERAGVDNQEPLSEAAISLDGRWLAFVTLAPSPGLGDTNAWGDVYLRDLVTGETALVSVATNGASSSADSYTPLVSSQGRFVLFRSNAMNLSEPRVPGFPNENVFLRDIQGSRTYPITTAGPPISVSFTPDGSRVGVLVYPMPYQPGANMVFRIWDSGLKQFVQIVMNLGPYYAALSPDGITYAGWNTNGSALLLGRVGEETNRVIYAGAPPLKPPRAIVLSGDGQRIAFTARDPLGVNQIYLHDAATGVTRLVTRDFASPGLTGTADSDQLVITPNGRFLAFRSAAVNLVPRDENGQPDLFLYEIESGNLQLITRSWLGDFAAGGRSGNPVFSGDSRKLLFVSWADDLIPFDYNGWGDVFQFEIPVASQIKPFNIALQPHAAGWELTWPAQAGVAYTVRCATDLSNPGWTRPDAPVTIMGSRAQLIDTSESAGPRFYQVLAK